MWIVPKKSDASGKTKWRIVLDYRKLNQITIPNKFPISNIDEIFDSLSNAKFFKTLDLAHGFHQILVKMEDRAKIAFSTHKDHYKYNCIPFGLLNAPSTFQRIINQTLTGLIGNEHFAYLDDILIFSFDTHLKKLRTVLQRLNANRLLI